jgi:AcrR family transcriptional regulator
MTSVDPLFDTLFRPTTLAPALASAAPVRAPGTRSRAGNAMNRTRAALLDGAHRAVEVSGTRITMAQVAAAAGVAKATLYNHFRTREAVLSALLVHEVTVLVEEFAAAPLADALSGAATAISRHPVVRALARIEPATLAAVACIDTSAEGWQIAGDGVARALAGANRGGADTVLRWLASYIVSPAGPTAVAADLAILLAGLPEASDAERAPGEAQAACGPVGLSPTA